MTEESSAPVALNQRHEIVDIVRGFALFGVLVANLSFTALWFATPGPTLEAMSTATLDGYVDLLQVWLVDHKFIALFSLLFGLGLAMQVRRARERGHSMVVLYLRRMLVLWVIGMAHAILVWHGDILQYYAVAGVTLLFLGCLPRRVVLATGLLLGVLSGLLPFLGWLLDQAAVVPDAVVEARYRAMTGGSWLDIVRMNLGVIRSDYSKVFDDLAGSALVWYLGPLWKAMIGYSIGLSGLHERPQDLARVARRMMPWFLGIGLSISVVPVVAIIGWDVWLASGGSWARILQVPVEFAAVALALGYACLLIVLWDRGVWHRAIGSLAAVGRTALTNYVMQSVLMVVLLYGIGFGLIGRVGNAACVAMSVAIFATQIAASAWWLRRFRFGPIEWLWRSLTYGRVQPMRRGRG